MPRAFRSNGIVTQMRISLWFSPVSIARSTRIVNYVWGEGALHLLPAGERHENQFATAVRCLRVKIGLQAIERLGDEFKRILSEPREISGPFSGWLANRMLREFRAQDDVAPLAMEGVLLEMLAESARSEEGGGIVGAGLAAARSGGAGRIVSVGAQPGGIGGRRRSASRASFARVP